MMGVALPVCTAMQNEMHVLYVWPVYASMEHNAKYDVGYARPQDQWLVRGETYQLPVSF